MKVPETARPFCFGNWATTLQALIKFGIPRNLFFSLHVHIKTGNCRLFGYFRHLYDGEKALAVLTEGRIA